MKTTRTVFDYRALTWKDFGKYCWVIINVMQNRYGIRAKQGTLNNRITADFNGLQIITRPDLTWEMKLALLVHLFGHTVQFNTSAELREIGLTRYKPRDINKNTLRVIRNYELMASRYGLQLLCLCGLHFLDQWASDWSNGDLDYLVMLYTTGKKYKLNGRTLRRYKRQYIHYGTKLIKPLPIPDFVPRKWPKRAAF